MKPEAKPTARPEETLPEEPEDPGPPNLDCMEYMELVCFIGKCSGDATGGSRIIFAREMFPSRRSRYITTTGILKSYATTKVMAIKNRLAGDVKTALICEEICERYYKLLPEWARW